MGKYNPAHATREDFANIFSRMTNEQILNRFAQVWARLVEHKTIIDQIDNEVTEARGGYDSLDERLDTLTPGGGGTTDYAELDNKPSIAGTTLIGNKTLADLGIAAASDLSALQTAVAGKAATSDLTAETTARTEADTKITAALAELIDSGAKNKLSINSGSTTSGQGYFIQNLPISLSAGTYIWSMKRNGNASTSFVLRDVNDNELARITRGAGVTDIVSEFTIADTAAAVSIYVGYSVSVTDAMICSRKAWDISQAFVPYRPNMQEMYEMIQALQPSSLQMTRVSHDSGEETKQPNDKQEEMPETTEVKEDASR